MANSLHQLHSSSLGLPPASYVYSLAPCGDDVLSVISSDNSLRYFDRQTLQLLPDGVFSSIHLRGGDDSGVTCLCPVNSGNQNLLATCGRDGIARLWDLRERRRDAVARFSTEIPYSRETVDFLNPPLTALAFNRNTQSLVAGTELVSHQASVVIWDIRSQNLPRLQYVDSHNDDITEVQFHPSQSNVLLSGSTDGLVNIYDTNVVDEDDALLQVIKHGSIHHAGFLNEQTVYALSHDEQFSIHPLTNPDDDDDGGEATEAPSPVHFGDLRPVLQCDYVAQIPSSSTGTYIAGGSASARTLSLTPIVCGQHFNFDLDKSRTWNFPGAHGEEIVRAVFLDEKNSTIYTCGEDGCVRVWKEDAGNVNLGARQAEEENQPIADSGPKAAREQRHEAATPERRKEEKRKGKKRGFKPY